MGQLQIGLTMKPDQRLARENETFSPRLHDRLTYYEDAEGVFLITHIKTVRRSRSQNAEVPVRRDRDRCVKKRLMEEGGAKAGTRICSGRRSRTGTDRIC